MSFGLGLAEKRLKLEITMVTFPHNVNIHDANKVQDLRCSRKNRKRTLESWTNEYETQKL